MAETTSQPVTPATDAAPPAAVVAPAPDAGAPPPAPAEGAPPPDKAADTPPAAGEKAPDEKAAETKPADALEVKLPEGIQAGEGLEKFKGLAKEFGLKGEQAQRVLDLFVEQQQAAEASHQAQMEKLHAGWLEAMKTDKEFGGTQFDANAQIARKAMLRFATPELRSFLNDSGLGDHPELVRMMWKVGKAIGEDSITGVSGAAPAGNTSDPDAILRARFPSMHPKES